MASKKISIIIISTIFLFSIISLVSAYNFGGYYSSPLDYLENPWIMFGIIFIILFGVIYYVLAKSFKNNAIAAAISLAISLFISMAISQRGLLSDYGGGELSSWALVIASLIAIAFFIRFVKESFGKVGVVIMIILIWIVLNSLEPYDILPTSLSNSLIFVIYEFLTSWISLFILIVLGFIFGGERLPKTLGEEIQGIFGKKLR
jgi:hypothetical protein